MTPWDSTCRERSATNFLICSATNLLEIYDVTDMASYFPKSTPATEHVATVRSLCIQPNRHTANQLPLRTWAARRTGSGFYAVGLGDLLVPSYTPIVSKAHTADQPAP